MLDDYRNKAVVPAVRTIGGINYSSIIILLFRQWTIREVQHNIFVRLSSPHEFCAHNHPLKLITQKF